MRNYLNELRRLYLYSSSALMLLFFTMSTGHGQLKVTGSESVTPPFSLTTQDGTGLELVSLRAKAVVDGPLAFTELHLTFQNPHSRTIEGRFEITMPDRAAISRFAMKIRGNWMEGEVVEKQAARRAYEDALHRRQDPALLEQDAGNQFRARVFPINGNERKELIISWSQELSSATERYTLPLNGLPEIQTLELTALVAKTQGGESIQSSLGGETSRFEVTQVRKTRYKPTQDWVLSGGDHNEDLTFKSEQVALMRVSLPEAQLAAPTEEHMIILLDSSASAMMNYENRLNQLELLSKELTKIGIKRVSLIAFDQSHQVIFDGEPSALGNDQLKVLRDREALGASNLEIGLSGIQAMLKEDKSVRRRLLIISDGAYNYGPSKPAELQQLLKKTLMHLNVQRVDALVDQSARDMIALEALTTAEGFNAGKVLTLDMDIAERARRLGQGTFGDLKAEISGAKWTWPSVVKGKQPGDQVLIFAEADQKDTLSLSLSGSSISEPMRFEPQERGVEQALLHRAWIRARIERMEGMMESADPDLRGVWRDQVIKLSTKHRVVSSYTALVVLENEWEYERFGIDRRALNDILVVGASGIEVKARTTPLFTTDPPVQREESKDRPAKKSAISTRRGPRESGAEEEATRESMAPARQVPVEEASEATASHREIADRPSDASEEEAELNVAPAQAEMVEPISPPPQGTITADEVAEVPIHVPVGGAREERPRSRQQVERRPSPPRRDEAILEREPDEYRRPTTPSLTGEMLVIFSLVEKGKSEEALKNAKKWRRDEPTNLLTLIALGRALEASGNMDKAARAYGSVIDFYPSRADMRRLAGNWLDRLGDLALELVISTYQTAAEQRPDHPSVYHMLGMALVKAKRFDEALTVLIGGLSAQRAARFQGVDRILREDIQLVAAAWFLVEPQKRATVTARLEGMGLRVDEIPSARFILSWETDANDVDFHIYDAHGNHAYYSNPRLSSGGELYADITTGYGPECFKIDRPSAYPYTFQAHYFRRGPMGYGAGTLQVVSHDGQGGLRFEDKPFVIMNDGAFVELGTIGSGGNVSKRKGKPLKIAQ